MWQRSTIVERSSYVTQRLEDSRESSFVVEVQVQLNTDIWEFLDLATFNDSEKTKVNKKFAVSRELLNSAA
jgi:hypothetical protein